jgi:hypothetical protein
MRLMAGMSYVLRASDGRWHDVSVDNDGAARCATARLEVDADGNVTRVTSEPAPTQTDDGARVEAASAGAKPRHGWSVSATRTIGNVGPVYAAECAALGVKIERSSVFERLTAADLDAVRDVPVMPDETPLADMAKPDEAWRTGYAATGGVVFVRAFVDGDSRECVSAPLAPPVLPRDPSPGVCPSCRVQRRERGEVRQYTWRCGCAVRPASVRNDEDLRWTGRGYSRERVWIAEGHVARATHPTEAGAVSAWREALANAQREEDTCR